MEGLGVGPLVFTKEALCPLKQGWVCDAPRRIIVPVVKQCTLHFSLCFVDQEVARVVCENRKPRRTPGFHELRHRVGEERVFAENFAHRQEATIVLPTELRVPTLSIVPTEQHQKIIGYLYAASNGIG